MKVCVSVATKTVEVWVDYSESAAYREYDEYKNVIAHHRGAYAINVYVGGERPLVGTITELLKEQSGSLGFAS